MDLTATGRKHQVLESNLQGHIREPKICSKGPATKITAISRGISAIEKANAGG